MKIKELFLISLICSIAYAAQTQDTIENKHFIETQAFMLLTPILDPSPEFYQLTYGYKLTPKDEISLELITWAYTGPPGRPLGPDFESESSNYPGDIKSVGAGLAYKRYLWKKLFARVHSIAFKQTYRNEAKKKIQSGFMLFNTLRVGYQFEFFNDRFFIAPSIAMTFWPVLTNMPETFQQEEDMWNKYFLGEPGLHVGYRF